MEWKRTRMDSIVRFNFVVYWKEIDFYHYYHCYKQWISPRVEIGNELFKSSVLLVLSTQQTSK